MAREALRYGAAAARPWASTHLLAAGLLRVFQILWVEDRLDFESKEVGLEEIIEPYI